MRSSSSSSNKRSLADSLLRVLSCFSRDNHHNTNSNNYNSSQAKNAADPGSGPGSSPSNQRLHGTVSASSRVPSSAPNATAASTTSKDSSSVGINNISKSNNSSLTVNSPLSKQKLQKEKDMSSTVDSTSEIGVSTQLSNPKTVSSSLGTSNLDNKTAVAQVASDPLAQDSSKPAAILPSVTAFPLHNQPAADGNDPADDAGSSNKSSNPNLPTEEGSQYTNEKPLSTQSSDTLTASPSNDDTVRVPTSQSVIYQQQPEQHTQQYTHDEYETDAEKAENEILTGHEVFNPYLEMVNEEGYLLSSLGPGAALLNPPAPELAGRKCLVLDLDETLVHSSFKSLRNADFIIPVEIDSQYHNVYVIKRPGVDEFMKRVGELYEVVVFTASVSRYGDPLLDQLDIHKVVHHRLFRESCYNHEGNYVKNLSVLGRPLKDTIILDNSPMSYIFHPQHAVPVSSWFSDTHDNELVDMIPFLEDLAKDKVRDVALSLDMNVDKEADKDENQFDLAPPFVPDPVANPVLGYYD